MPTVNGLLGGVNGLIPNAGTTSAENAAIAKLTANGQAGNQFAPAISSVATNLLNGGGATSQNGTLQSNLDAFKAGMAPYTAADYSTLSTPAVQAALSQAGTAAANNVRSQFAAAGRSFSGLEDQNIAQGISQAQTPIILDQANRDAATRQAALGAVYGAGNTTSGAISGNNQQGINNSVQGVSTANDALSAENWGPQQVITAQELAKSIPASNLGLLAQIGIPLAQLGTNSNGTSTTESQMSPVQMITGLASSLGSGKSATGGGSGLLGLLGML